MLDPKIPVATQRLKTDKDFQRVFSSRQKLFGDFFLAYYHPNQLTYSRLGVSISKRMVKTAPRRNYLKRVIKEAFRHHQYELSGLDLVIIANQKAQQAGKNELWQCIEALLARVAEAGKKSPAA